MKDFNYYNNNEFHWPSKKDYTRYNVFDCPNVFGDPTVLGRGLTKVEAEDIAKQHKEAIIVSYFMDEEFKQARRDFSENERKLQVEFEQDVFAEFDVTDNPKADKAMRIAWDKGHSQGFERIYEEFEELVELIR